MRTIWRIRLVVGTILSLIALFTWAERSFALTVSGWNILGGFDCAALGDQAFTTMPTARQYIPGLTTNVAYICAGSMVKDTVADGMYVDKVSLSNYPIEFVADAGSRSAPSSATGAYGYFAMLSGSVGAVPTVASTESDWAIFQMPQQFSGFAGSVGGVQKFNNYTLARYQEYLGAGQWLRTTEYSGAAADDAYSSDLMNAFPHTWVGISAEWDDDSGWWDYSWRISDRLLLHEQGFTERWALSGVGTGTVLPVIAPTMVWPSACQQVEYPTMNGAAKLDEADLVDQFNYSWGASGMVAESFDPTAVGNLDDAVAMGWDPSMDIYETPVIPDLVDTDTVAPKVVPGWLSDWLDQFIEGVITPWRDSLSSWLWPLEVIGDL